MPAEPSFDIVSRIDRQEVDNALNQTAKEIGTRFDFRGVGASIAWSGDHAIDIRANSEERAKAVLDVFKEKLVKRGVSLKALDPGDPKPSGKEYRLGVGLKEGISSDDARKISKLIRDVGPKGVRAQVQGEELPWDDGRQRRTAGQAPAQIRRDRTTETVDRNPKSDRRVGKTK